MKKNAFYFITAIIIALELIHFRFSIGTGGPLPFTVGMIIGIAIIYIARLYVDDIGEDERTQRIREKTALGTLQISWVALLIFSAWMVIEGAGNRINPELRRLGLFGIALFLIDTSMIAIFILLSFYYRKQFGE